MDFFFSLVGTGRVEFLFDKSDDQMRDLQDHCAWPSFVFLRLLSWPSQPGNGQPSPPILPSLGPLTLVSEVPLPSSPLTDHFSVSGRG